MSSSVQFDSGNTRIDSPGLHAPVVEAARIPAAGSSGPIRGWRCGTRTSAPWRATSPRRAGRRRTPRRSRAASAPASAPRSSSRACSSAPWSNGLMPCRRPSSLVWTIRFSPSRATVASRNAIISRNFQPVSTCSSGNGGLAGVERLHRQMQHHRRILADRIQHHRRAAFRHHLADDVDAFVFQAAQMRDAIGRVQGGGRGLRGGCSRRHR